MTKELNIHQKAELARQLAYQTLQQDPKYKSSSIPANVLNEKINELMQLSDKDLQARINQCFASEKKEKDLWDVMGLELSDEEKRRANLRMQNEYERLKISMSPDTEKTRQAAKGVEFRAGLREAGIPVEIPQETRTPEQEQAVAFLEDMAQAADENMLSQMDRDGVVGKAYNLFIKEAFDTEFAKSNVEEAIEDTKVDVAALRTTVDFEATFEERRGVKFDPQKIREVSEKADLTAKYQACSDMVGALKSELSKAIEGSKDDPRAGEKAILQTAEALGLDAGAVVSAALKGHENDPAIKNGLKEGGAFAIKDEGNGKFGIYREAEDGSLQPITQEQAEIIGKEMSNILDKFEAQVLGTKIPENATSEEIAELNEARIKEIRADYEKSFAEAYGEKDLEKLSQNYMMSQEKGKIYVQTGVTLLAMAGAMFTGGGSLALASAAVLATNPVDLLEKSTDADGMTKDDWKNYGQSTLEQIGWMALGGVVGKVGDVARSFVKVKGLSKAMKESGKSFDDFMKLAAKSPDIPKDMAKSLKTVSRLANTAGVTTEVALDMAATMALQKDGATAMDWAMSIGGALVGTKLQKVMAPMSEDAKVKYLMDTFKDFKLSENEAKQLLKAMADSESGAAAVKSNKSAERGAVLEGGIRADELDEVAPFAKRLENEPHVGDYIPVPETKLNIKEFKNRLSSLRDKDNKPLVSDFTIEQYTQLFGAENLPNVSAFIDEARVKYGDEFVNHVVRSIAANNSLNKEDAVNLMRRLINEFDGTTENASKIISAGWLLNHSEAKAAQILLDMPKRTNSKDTPWPDAKSLLDNAGKFKDKKSVAALERAVSLKAENGLNIYDTKDIDSIVQAKELLTSDIYTDEEIKKLRFAVIGLYKNPADLEDVSKVLTAKENTELQAQVKDILKNSDGMKMFGLVRQLQPEIYEKITDLRLSSLEIPDKALKSLIKRNITKINDPQNRLEFLEQMQKYLPDLSEVKDKYILGKIHGETAKIVEYYNTDGLTVTFKDYKKLETYIDIDKEFRGEETYSYGNASKYLSYMEKEYPDEAKVFKDLAEKYETMSADEFENYFQTQVGTNSDITPLHIANYVKDKKIETLKNFMRENYYQEGNLNYTRRETAHIRQLYEDKYLSTLPAETRECCQKIYDSFGVKIFVADENDTNSLNYIYNELLEWQKAGKGKATLPPILDLSVIKQGYIDKVFRSGGYHENPSHNISINAEYLDSIKHAIRHEIAHANDSKIKQKSGIITVYNKDGTEEEINIDEIIVHKTEHAKDADGNLLFNPDGTPVMVKAKAEDGTFVPDFDKCKYVDEFRNAGIPDRHISYAYNNKAEFLAVAAEGDYSKYSKEFKELLVKLGLPDWMFKMKNKNNVDSQENLYFNEKFSDRYTPEQNQAISSNSEKLFNMVAKNKQKVIDDYDGSFAFTLPGTKLYKRIKDFEGVNEKIYRELDRIDKKIRDVSDIETYNATKLKPGDEPLTQEMADALIEKYNIQKQNLINNYDEVYNTLQDVFGARLVMDDCSPASVSKVFNALLQGIDSGKFKILEINNYQGAGGIPYFSSAQIKQIQSHCRRQGYDVKIVSDVNAPKGREAEYQNAFNSAKAIKQSGYTTCQMNIEHSNGVISEFQIRGKHINELAESEHIFYDISQNKDLSRGNPQIKRITDPLVKVVEEMNAKGNEHIKEAYSKYLTECYKYARMQELGISMKKPTLPSEVDPMLDIDNIIRIHEMIEQAK